MKLLRAKHFLLTVAAMFSLFVSAVSACACSHHETVKAEAESCHGSSHEALAAEPLYGAAYIESDCRCLERTPVPAIVKKDDKRTIIAEQTEDLVELPLTFAIEPEIADASDISFEPPQSNYHHALLSSLPSRAPPCL